MRKHLALLLLMAGLLLDVPAYAQARNAAFMNPNAGSSTGTGGKSGNMANTVVADPATIDAGETLVNVARRITVFFYNGFRAPVQINDLTLNADGNVRSKVMSDDCKTLKTLPVSDKCSIAIEITPSSPGPWSVELLLNHSGQGRIARAEVTGSTLGKADEKSEGLAISKKIAAPLDFGAVKPFVERAARTMLIENDSAEKLLISKIDLISDDDSLSLRDVGCKEGDELKPGESCPVTVMWAPTESGTISTDLLINHNGNLGYVVVPIRGKAESEDETIAAENESKGGARKTPQQRQARSTSNSSRNSSGRASAESSKPSASQLDNLPVAKQEQQEAPRRNDDLAPPNVQDVAQSLPPIQSDDVVPKKKQRKAQPMKKEVVDEAPADGELAEAEVDEVYLPELTLIGTMGRRAILGDDQSETHTVGLGEQVNIGGVDVELVQLEPSRAVVSMAGKRKELRLRNTRSIMQASKSTDGGGNSAAEETTPKKKVKSKKHVQDDDEAVIPTTSGNKNISGAGDGSAPASAAPTSSSSLPITGASEGSSNSGNATSGGTGLPSTMTVQDVLNMMN